jgi:hypothetical protein
MSMSMARLLANIRRRQPAIAAASNMLRVPSMFTGESISRGECRLPDMARCTTVSMPVHKARMSSVSRTSAMTPLAPFDRRMGRTSTNTRS